MNEPFTLGTPERPSNEREAEFWRFHAENPMIYWLFDRFAHQVIARNRTRFSSDAILHRIRWETNIETTGAEPFKINDHCSAYYARLWMRNNPTKPMIFSTRGLTAAVCEDDTPEPSA